MKYYVEAYYADGNPVPGHVTLRCRNNRRTKGYRALRHGTWHLHRVSYYRIATEGGRVLETLI
jgi:hypothetical protein